MKILLVLLALLTSLNAAAKVEYTKIINPMTDENTSLISIPQNDCTEDLCVFLVVRNTGDIYFYYASDGAVFDIDNQKLDVRFDTSKAGKITATNGQSKRTIFIHNTQNAPFLDELKARNKLTISYQSKGSTLYAVFDLSGFTKSLKNLPYFKADFYIAYYSRRIDYCNEFKDNLNKKDEAYDAKYAQATMCVMNSLSAQFDYGILN